MLRLPILLLVVVASCQHSSPSKLSYGPLHMRSQASLGLLRFTPMPESAEVAEPGSISSFFARGLANYHIVNDDLVMDLETVDSYLSLKVSLPWGIELGGTAESHEVTVAGLDRFTTEFHKFFKLSQDERKNVDENQTHLQISALEIDLTGDQVENPISKRFNLQVRKEILSSRKDGFGLTVGLTGSAEMQTMPGLTEGDRRDVAIHVYMSRPLGRHAFHANGHYVMPGRKNLGLLILKPAWTFMLGYEIAYWFRTSTHLQATYGGPLTEGDSHLSDPTVDIVVGQKLQFREFTLEAGILENIAYHGNTADWALFCAAEVKL